MIKVNGSVIPQEAIDFELQRLIKFYARHLPEDQLRSQLGALREQAKEQSIGARLLFEEAQRLDIKVTDEEVAERIAALTEQVGGAEKLQAMLAKQGSNKVQFTEQVRNGRRVDKLVDQAVSECPEPTEEECLEHFNEHSDEYSKPEQAQAQHILVKPAAETPDAKLEALGKLNQLRSRIEAGEDFSELAAAHSACPSGKSAGGSLGWFPRGAMAKEFDEAVFSMQVGELSQAIETQFGYHLIKKLAHEDPATPTYDEIHDQIKEFLHHAKRGEALSAYVAELREKAVIEED